MRFVAVKTEAQQAHGMVFRTRDLLVRQRTQTINALRGIWLNSGSSLPKGSSISAGSPRLLMILVPACQIADLGKDVKIRFA